MIDFRWLRRGRARGGALALEAAAGEVVTPFPLPTASGDGTMPWGWSAGPVPYALPRDFALQVPAVRRGLNLIAGTIGSLPLGRWRGTEQIDPGTFLAFPEDYRPVSKTIAATVRDLICYPYAWWQVVERDYTGYPRRVRWLDAGYVSFSREFGTDERSGEYAFYKGREIPRTDLIAFEGPDDGILCHGRTAIATAYALEQAAGRYASPDIPTGILKQEGQYSLTEPEVDDLLDRWERSRRAHSTGYLNAGIDYRSIQSSASDLQLVEAREESVKQIARLIGVPPRYLGVSAGDSMTYANIASERADFVELYLSPYMDAIAGRLSMPDRNGTPLGQSVRFDQSDFLLGAPLDRAQRLALLLTNRVIDNGEAREMEHISGPAPQAPAPAAAPPAAPPPALSPSQNSEML